MNGSGKDCMACEQAVTKCRWRAGKPFAVQMLTNIGGIAYETAQYSARKGSDTGA